MMALLRRAVEADVPLLVELARRSWLSAFSDTAPPALTDYWRALDREPAFYATYWPSMTVAEESGRLLGLVQPMEDEVNGLWIDPLAQGRGVGLQLLRAAEGEIAAAGFDRAWLTCSAWNVRALRFYARAGYFHEVRRIVVQLNAGAPRRVDYS